jgi:hypothetical protein
VGSVDGGVLLAGQGGAGKSTTTLACLAGGLAVAADDYTLLSLDPLPYGYSLYNTAKLRTLEDMRRFPQFLPGIANVAGLDGEKPMIFLHQHWPQSVLRGFPIRAILLPQICADGATAVRRATAAAALKALAPSTLLQLPGLGQGALQAMSRLVRLVPAYTLALGPDLARIPAVVAGLLRDLA